MITQGVEITSRCQDCGGVLVRDVGQYIDRGQVRWSIEARCEECPNGWCEQGSDEPTPGEIRLALLAVHGPARLRLADEESSRLSVLRGLREVLSLSLDQARAKAAELGRTGLVGTLVEMELLAEALNRRSVATTITTIEQCTG